MLTLKVTGGDEAARRLRKLAAAQRKVSRRALDKAATIQLRATKAALKRHRTGLTGKSLGKRVTTYDNGNVVAMVGPRHGFRTTIKERVLKGRREKLLGERGKRAGDTKKVTLKAARGVGVGDVLNPAYTAHLIEGGHKRGGGTSEAPAYPFVRPAFERTKGEALKTIGRELGTVAREA